jgi:hypothetical protein
MGVKVDSPYKPWEKLGIGDPGVLIYTMARVGTNTTRYTLEQMEIQVSTSHYSVQDEQEFGLDPYGYFDQIRVDREREWKIISLMRDPIARNISTFFWSIKKYYDRHPQTFDPRMIKAFTENYPFHDTPITWFERELIPFLDFNIYEHPFDREAGFTIYDTPYAQLLLLKTEQLTEVGAEAFSTLFEKPCDEIVHRSHGSKRFSGGAFRDFHDRAKFSKEYLDRMYDNDHVRYFYTEEEIEDFRKKWSKLS